MGPVLGESEDNKFPAFKSELCTIFMDSFMGSHFVFFDTFETKKITELLYILFDLRNSKVFFKLEISY